MKKLLYLSLLFFSLSTFSQSLQDPIFAIGIGINYPNKLKKLETYYMGYDGSILFNKFYMGVSGSISPGVRENEYGSGGISDKHQTVALDFGYKLAYRNVALVPTIGYLLDNTLYNDLYYNESSALSESYFNFGGVFMWKIDKAICYLKSSFGYLGTVGVMYVF